MAAPWQTLATVGTSEGRLELRRRRDDWLMMIDGRVLMNSFSRRSEEELSRLGLERLGHRPAPRVLVSGLGMGFTLRALLDGVPAAARVVVAELNPVVVEWCRGPLGPATNNAIGDPRVRVEVGDVAALIARVPAGSFDLILLDMYEGPNTSTQAPDDPIYGPAALARLHRALTPNGVAGIWSEDADARFQKRFAAAGFAVTKHSFQSGPSRHIVYTGRRAAK
jgi:spermidine synthase